MNVLVHEPINQISSLIVNALIQNGFKVLSVPAREHVEEQLRKGTFQILVLDIDGADKSSQDFSRKLLTSESHPAKIIAHLRNASKELVVELVKIGTAGFILKPFDPGAFIRKFLEIYTKLDPADARMRKHIRITPNPKDEASITIRSSVNFKLISGKLSNLSVGGALFDSFGGELSGELVPGMIIKNVQLKFRLNTIETAITVVAVQEKSTAVKFVQMPEYDKNVLCKYIYDTLVAENLFGHE